MKEKTTKKIIVIKLGTSVLTAGTKQLQKERIMELVRQCSRLHKMDYNVIIVTSGAIAAGREYLNYPELPSGIAYKQLLASVGQSKLIQLWEQLFSIYSIKIGQMLLTRADIEHRERFLNARDTLLALLEHEIIPIINENDAVVTAEIKVGDNDTLSALVAILARADLLLLLTDIDGLYTENPQNNKKAQLIKIVSEITDDIWSMATGSVSGLGTGGMTTKIQAANIACSAGIKVIIANGGTENSIERIIEGENLGTQFLAHKSPLEERKRWIFGAPTTGSVIIDDGAITALMKKGSSLLPIGINDVNGVFSRGEVIKVQNNTGIVIAYGVSRYSSESLLRIAGHHSHEIIHILGYEYGPVIIHRDDMIIL